MARRQLLLLAENMMKYDEQNASVVHAGLGDVESQYVTGISYYRENSNLFQED